MITISYYNTMGIQQSNNSSHASIVSSASNHSHSHEDGIHYKNLLHINKIINNKINNNNHNNITTITIRANIIKYIDYEKLWNNFLDSTYSSFAITESELIYLLKQSIQLNYKDNKDDKTIMIDIMNYITLVDELTSPTFISKTSSLSSSSSSSSSKLYDFISVCSSVLLLSNNYNIDIKSSQLFEWICMKVN